MTTISNNDIARAIYAVAKDKSGHERSVILTKVVEFLARRHMLGKSKEILSQLRKIINKETRTVEANVLSAKALPAKTKKELEHILTKRYSAKEIILNEELDPKLLGGFRVEVNNEVIDLTLKNKIAQLQNFLTRSTA